MRKYTLLFIVICLSPLLAKAETDCGYLTSVQALINCECAEAYTTFDLNNCMAEVYAKVDQELNRVYQKVMKYYSNYESASEEEYSQARKETLRNAQRAWIKFRDANADWIYAEYMQGSIRNQSYLSEKTYMTLSRINQLKRRTKDAFSDEITKDKLVGTWQMIQDKNQTLQFTKDGNFRLTKGGKTTKEGLYEIDDVFLIVKDKTGKTILDEWIYLENRITNYWEDEYALEFLHGEGLSSDEIFIKVDTNNETETSSQNPSN